MLTTYLIINALLILIFSETVVDSYKDLMEEFPMLDREYAKLLYFIIVMFTILPIFVVAAINSFRKE